ncbi:ileal sodium/bile acid cotransporter-like [Ptychodera flava]|uniref:ileal sodium/bile acid cotransporter-like n=1 Tax=Ptychodera flava TaxID=63121 RepID=UPI00396A5305
METTTNTLNSTEAPAGQSKLLIANQAVIIITLIVMMFGMGATITLREVWDNIKKPIGPIIGVCCQFLISPFLGWALAMAVDLPPAMAIGTLAIATCPGGTFSNVLTFLSEGDTCLSIVMTTFSTIFAIAFMPLWLFVYSRSWIEAAAALPYRDIIIALVLILIPGALGMLVRWKWPKHCQKIAMVCSIITLIGIVATIVIIGFMNPAMFTSSWKPYIVAILLPTFAFSLGYLIPWALRQGHKKSRTIAFETGIQNTALAITVLNIADITDQGGLSSPESRVVPSLHGLISFLVGISMIGVYLLYKKFCKKDKVTPEDEVEEMKEENGAPTDGGVVNKANDVEVQEDNETKKPESQNDGGNVDNQDTGTHDTNP